MVLAAIGSATAEFLPLDTCKSRPGVTDASWPISFDQLVPYYRKANRLLELGNFDYDKAAAKSLAYGIEPSAEGPLAPFIWRLRLEGPLRFGLRMREEMENVANIQCLSACQCHRIENQRSGKPD